MYFRNIPLSIKPKMGHSKNKKYQPLTTDTIPSADYGVRHLGGIGATEEDWFNLILHTIERQSNKPPPKINKKPKKGKKGRGKKK